MIRLITIEDSKEYLDHLIRVKNSKGFRAVNQEDKKNELSTYYTLENIENEILNSQNYIWCKFENDKIVSSLFANKFKREPLVFFVNYKNEGNNFFNPLKNILELADYSFNYFIPLEIYRYLLIRPLELFNYKRFSNIEDLYPLNKFNSYFDEIIPANQKSKYSLYNYLLNDKIFDIDLAVVQMSLKQQFRLYNDKKLLPLKNSKSN